MVGRLGSPISKNIRCRCLDDHRCGLCFACAGGLALAPRRIEEPPVVLVIELPFEEGPVRAAPPVLRLNGTTVGRIRQCRCFRDPAIGRLRDRRERPIEVESHASK